MTIAKMHKIFFGALLLTLISSCKGQNTFVDERLKTVDKFIDCLKNNLPDKILDYTFPDVDYNINNKEFRDFEVNKAYKFLKKFGLPSKDKWIIKYDPQNNFDRLLITIPLFKGYDSIYHLLKANLVISFPPSQISDKIYRYKIDDEYEPRPLLAPPLLDTTKN